jgi:hypothetical protein
VIRTAEVGNTALAFVLGKLLDPHDADRRSDVAICAGRA